MDERVSLQLCHRSTKQRGYTISLQMAVCSFSRYGQNIQIDMKVNLELENKFIPNTVITEILETM